MLNSCDRDQFPLPGPMASGKTFRDMFVGTNGEGKTVNIVFDEADNLAALPTDMIADFLQVIRGLRQTNSSLRGVALLGTHKLLNIVQHRTWSPSHYSSPFTAVRGNLKQLNCLQAKLQRTRQRQSRKSHADAPVAITRCDQQFVTAQPKSQQRLLQAEVISPGRIGKSQIVDLLEQWHADNRHYVLEPGIETFAEDIFELCGGHAGLTGFCCYPLSKELAASDTNQYTAAAWAKHCAITLPDKLSSLGTYERIIQDLPDLESASLDLLHEVGCLHSHVSDTIPVSH